MRTRKTQHAPCGQPANVDAGFPDYPTFSPLPPRQLVRSVSTGRFSRHTTRRRRSTSCRPARPNGSTPSIPSARSTHSLHCRRHRRHPRASSAKTTWTSRSCAFHRITGSSSTYPAFLDRGRRDHRSENPSGMCSCSTSVGRDLRGPAPIQSGTMAVKTSLRWCRRRCRGERTRQRLRSEKARRSSRSLDCLAPSSRWSHRAARSRAELAQSGFAPQDRNGLSSLFGQAWTAVRPGRQASSPITRARCRLRRSWR